jgi:lysophospholipase L1-like esterase
VSTTTRATILKRLGLSLLSLILCLVLTEWVMARWLPAPAFLRLDISSYGAEYLLSPNRDLIYTPKPNSGDYNAQGHRGATFSIARNEKPRLLFIGDSVVEGFGESEKDRFTTLLAQSLSDVEMINFGVRGYNLRQTVAYFKTFGRQFSPDHVYVGITYNDLMLHSGEIYNIDQMMESNARSSFYKRYYNAKTEFDHTLLKLNIYRHLAYSFASTDDDSFDEAVSYLIDEAGASALLDELNTMATEDQFGLTVLFLPFNTNYKAEDVAMLKQLCEDKTIHFLDLNAEANAQLTGIEKRDLFLPKDPCHFNRSGHLRIASRLKEHVATVSATQN